MPSPFEFINKICFNKIERVNFCQAFVFTEQNTVVRLCGIYRVEIEIEYELGLNKN